MRKKIALYLFLGFLAGCSTTTWTKSGITYDQGKKDDAACRSQAGVVAHNPSNQEKPVLSSILDVSGSKREMYNDCMKGKGYAMR